MNDQFQRLAVIADYSSFIWTTRYYTSGDFQLIVDANEKNMSILQKFYYVVRDDDENVGIIEDLHIQRDQDGNEKIIITGRFLDAVLARRIIAKETTLEGKVSDCIEQLIDENVINPDIAARQISNFTIDSYEVSTEIQVQYTGQNLLEAISNLCKTYNIGYKVTLNDDNDFVFKLYEGVDRTYDQSTNPWVIFSDTYNNLLSSDYEENYQNTATAVWVAGEGEGEDRIAEWVTDGSTGLERCEAFKDGKDIKSDNGEIYEDEYRELLKEAGKECLTKYTTAFTGTVYFGNTTYREDINVRDLCVIENSRWGLYLNTRLVEVIESVDETGEYSITPTFGV